MDVLGLHNPPDVIAASAAAIHQEVLAESRHIVQPNFERIAADDLDRIFGAYDRLFFDGWLGRTVKVATVQPLTFRLSPRMTRAGGKTIKYSLRSHGDGYRFEIAIASRMLFMTFQDVPRPVIVCGLTCKDRLEALQRIMEHEIIHLAELLVWGQTSCSQPRFKKLALRIFGHQGITHDLVTVHEHAARQHGVRVSDMVQFELEGRSLIGRINRIHHRATVLVKDTNGRPYSDGGKYRAFYVPLKMLRPVCADQSNTEG